MKRIFWVCAIATVVGTWNHGVLWASPTSRTSLAPVGKPEQLSSWTGLWKVQPAISYLNLTIYPVKRMVSVLHGGQYITLDEGLKQKLVTITEKGSRLLSTQESQELAQLGQEREKLMREFGGHLYHYPIRSQWAQQRIIPQQVQQNIPNQALQQRNNAPNQVQQQRQQRMLPQALNRNPRYWRKQPPPKLTAEQERRLPEAKKRYHFLVARISALNPHRGGRVNFLDLHNQSKQTLYLLAGEMVIGGKQDRIVAENILIPPGQTTTIQVFCVEKGRWRYQTAKFQTNAVLAHNKLRLVAQSAKNQGAVWREVGLTNAKMKTHNPSHTYRFNYQNKEALQRINTYYDALIGALRHKEMVGVLVAIDGRLTGADIFSDPNMFAKVRDKLLRSYAVEAVPAVSSKVVKQTTSPQTAQVQAFLQNLRRGKITVEKQQKNFTNLRIVHESFTCFGLQGKDFQGRDQLLHLNCARQS